ncbi:hypothetical protein [Blastopirellula marina]|nr:hypothetical protein [Blastopirellula marina]
MFRSLWIAGAVALAPLFAADSVEAQYVTTAVAPPTAVGYVPVRTGLFGLRTTMKPVLVPGAVTTYVNSPVVTTNYLPTTTYYTPEVQTTYYAPEVTTSYYAPEATTTYYAPAAAPAPVTTSYYTPAPTAAPVVNAAPPVNTTYYRKTYWYSTPAPVPRSVGMPIIGY